MKINWEHTREIEKYLDGELTPQERIAFEARMGQDAGLREEVAFHEKIRNNIEHYGERARLKRKMNAWAGEKTTHASASRARKLNWRTVGMAASLSLVITTGAVTIYHFISQKGIEEKIGELKLSAQQSVVPASYENAGESDNTAKSVIIPSNLATAFAVSRDGYFLTSYHAVKGPDQVFIEQFGENPATYRAHVVKVDQQLDIALLKIDDTTFTGFSSVPFSFAGKPLELTQRVYSLGYPNKKDVVFSEGAVSGLTGYKSDTLSCQVSILANPGNSGSPVLNEKGELVGMIASKNPETEGETYFTRTAYIRQFIAEITQQEKYKSINLNGRSPLRGKNLMDQVKTITPYVFIVRTENR